jgi:hypothetical protein
MGDNAVRTGTRSKLKELGWRSRYFAWAAGRCFTCDSRCPLCGSDSTSRVARKSVVTALYECAVCGLRFRVPKGSALAAEEFYRDDRYATVQPSFTVDLPSDAELERLLACSFKDSPKDFTRYVELLRGCGAQTGDVVLDFGSSWGYGSWQLRRAGFDVWSYEISRIRAEYAKGKLGCKVVPRIEEVMRPVKYFFAAHVAEHLPDPNILMEAARAVEAKWVLLVTPNGEPCRMNSLGPADYHRLWGLVHPLLFTMRGLKFLARRHGYGARILYSPWSREDFELGGEAVGDGGDFLGSKVVEAAELVLVAWALEAAAPSGQGA